MAALVARTTRPLSQRSDEYAGSLARQGVKSMVTVKGGLSGKRLGGECSWIAIDCCEAAGNALTFSLGIGMVATNKGGFLTKIAH